MEIKTRVLPADEAGVAEAAQLLRQGQLVALPTETVYGIAADARNGAAVRNIFVAKGRPQDNPLIVHVTGPEMLPGLVSEVPERAQLLMAAFCPGPLTIIMPRGPEVADECCAGLDTVGIRMPSHPVARAVIAQSGCAFAAPSANLSGKPSPTTAEHVRQDMDGRVDLIIDGGPCKYGLESTVVSLIGRPTILRPGAVTKEMLEAVIGPVDVAHAVLSPLREGETAASPGMKYRHYAPDAEVVVAEGKEREIAAKICREYDAREAAGEDCIIFATKQTQPFYRGRNCVIIGDRTEPATLCASLFYSLREYGGRADVIFAEALPNDDMGLAYMNRLLRSAGFNII